MNTFTLKVNKIKQETKDAVTLCFKQPGLKKVKYIAGQYLTLIFRINGRKYLRPYSFSSAPEVDEYIEVTVKRIKGGVVSNYINDEIKVNDVIEVLAPMGDFTFIDKSNISSLFFWGVGSGITPLFSIIKSVLKTRPEINVNLIYGNKNIANTIFWSQLKELEICYQPRLKIWHFHTENGDDISVLSGRIVPERVISDFAQNTIENSMHFICGPSDLKENLKKCLINLNIKSEYILSEDFHLSLDPEVLRNIEDRTVQLYFKQNLTELFISKGKSILEEALDAGIELPYSCQTGNCNTCKAVVKAGEVKMLGLGEQRKDLNENEFLMCCSYPLTDNVMIEI